MGWTHDRIRGGIGRLVLDADVVRSEGRQAMMGAIAAFVFVLFVACVIISLYLLGSIEAILIDIKNELWHIRRGE